MNKYLAIFIIIALTASGVSYLVSENIFITIGVFVIYAISSYVLFIPKLVKYEKVIQRFHECYHFINNFIISLSIKKTIGLALENVSLSMNTSFQEMFSSLQDMSDEEKIKYLNGNYFPFHLYQLFIQVISLYQEQGGDILKMSKYLLSDLRYNEEYVSKVQGQGVRKCVEIGVLWLICFAILGFVRFALKDFYASLKQQTIFIVSIALFMVFVLFSIYVLVNRSTNIKLKGYNPHEKII